MDRTANGDLVIIRCIYLACWVGEVSEAMTAPVVDQEMIHPLQPLRHTLPLPLLQPVVPKRNEEVVLDAE